MMTSGPCAAAAPGPKSRSPPPPPRLPPPPRPPPPPPIPLLSAPDMPPKVPAEPLRFIELGPLFPPPPSPWTFFAQGDFVFRVSTSCGVQSAGSFLFQKSDAAKSSFAHTANQPAPAEARERNPLLLNITFHLTAVGELLHTQPDNVLQSQLAAIDHFFQIEFRFYRHMRGSQRK